MTADPTARRLLLWAVLAAPLSADAQSFSQLSESLGAAPAEVRAPQPVPAAAEGPAGMARVDFLVRSEALHAPGAQLFNPFDTYAKSAGEPGAADIPYLHLARAQAEEQGVDLALILAVIQKESSFDPNALSPKGAVGLMQLMPDTAAWLGLKDARRLTKPEVNIKYGVMYLKYL